MSKYIIIVLLNATLMSSTLYASDNVKSLKTFFTTANERAKLDQMRVMGKFDQKNNDKSSVVFEKSTSTVIELKGIMIRENGDTVAWVNDTNTLKSNNIDKRIKVNTKNINKNSLKVPLNVDQKYLKLKPGQQWDESVRKVNDKYQLN